MNGTNRQAIQGFVETCRGLNYNSIKSGHIFSERDRNGYVLYSYGYHFPLAVYTGTDYIYINKNKYSRTTSMHQGYLRQAIKEVGFDIIEKTTEELQDIIKG